MEKKNPIYPNTQIGFMKRGIGKTESDYSNNANLVANNVANANPTNCINHVNNQLEQSYQNIPELYMKPKNQLNSQYDYDISEAYKVDPFQPDDDNLYKFMNYSMEDNSYLTINKTQDRSKSKENIVPKGKKKAQFSQAEGLGKSYNNPNLGMDDNETRKSPV